MFCFVVSLFLECESPKLRIIKVDVFIFSISKESLIFKWTDTYCFTVDVPEGDLLDRPLLLDIQQCSGILR